MHSAAPGGALNLTLSRRAADDRTPLVPGAAGKAQKREVYRS